jgi:hypothetical protein
MQEYEYWKQGKEVPLSGTPIADWPLATLDQKAKCLSCNIRTIEDLATCNQEAIGRIGMGAQMLRNRANEFLQAKNELGPVVMRVESQAVTIEEMQRKIRQLEDENRALKMMAGIDKVNPNQNTVAQAAGFQPQQLVVTELPEEVNPNLVGEALEDTLKEL